VTRTSHATFPELRRVFSAYLHEDFRVEAGTPETALRTFWTDAAPDERRRFQREAERFIAQTASLDLAGLRALVHDLGCRWVPPSREALVDVLTAPANQPDPPER
jgi:hypothetical protein